MKVIMMNKKSFKIFSAAVVLLTSASLLTACGNKVTTSVGQQKVQNNNQPKNVQLNFNYGDIAQSEGLLTVPVFINNAGTNSTVISSQNFTLIIDGHKFKPFQIEGEPGDFHDDLGASNSWQNTLSFYLGTDLTRKQLKQAYFEYEADNGSKIRGKYLNSSDAQAKMQNVTFKATTLGNYYSSSEAYIEQAKEELKNSGSVNSLKSQFRDNKYDRFRLWFVGSSKYPDIILIKAINNTNTDLVFPFSSFQLKDKDKNDIRVHPSYRNYAVQIPHGKSINIGIPMETKLSAKEAPYTVMFRGDNDSTFTSTAKTFNPAEAVFNDSKDLDKAFATEPDQYPKRDIKWLSPKLGKKDLTVTVKLFDYFYIEADKDKYRLVGLNNDGTVGESVKPLKVTPEKVTKSGTKMQFDFDDLTVVKTYKKIALQYNKKTLFKIK